MVDEKVSVGVLEDELSVGRIWLKVADKYRWTEVEEAPFTAAGIALEWVEQQIKSGRVWILVLDIDLPGDELNAALEEHRRDFQREHPGVAQFSGAVLLSYLITEHDVRSHLLVVTGQAYGQLTEWIQNAKVDVLFKPVSSEDLGYKLSDLRSNMKKEKEKERNANE